MEVNDYISIVRSHIKNKSYIASVEQELRDHIFDRAQYYEQIGYDSEASLAKAMERIGNPNDIGEQMNRLHDDKRTRICSTVVSVIMCIFFLGFLFGADSLFGFYGMFSSTKYGVFSDVIFMLVFLAIHICAIIEFTLVCTTRNSREMMKSANQNFLLIANMLLFAPDSIRQMTIDFKAIKPTEIFEDLNMLTSVMLIYIIYVLALMFLTGVIAYFMSVEFKAFEAGKAHLDIIYKLENFKYFLYASLLPCAAFIILCFVG